MTLFTIVIPTRNRYNQISKCINSIIAQVISDPPPIIIVDDGSDKNNASANKQLCQKYNLHYIYNETASGPASARNRGASFARSHWIVFLDDDVITCSDWLQSIISKLSKCPAEIIGIEGRVEPSGGGLWDREVQNRSGGSFLSCHIAYRSETFNLENGFDILFNGPYCEDHELAARMLLHGLIQFDYDLFVIHQPRTIHRLKYFLSAYKRTWLLLDSEYRFFSKHPDRYHRFRKSRTFTGTLISNIFLLMFQEIKRRSFSQVICNIHDTFILLLSSTFEQLSSVIWLINNFKTLLNPVKLFFSRNIDLEKTAIVWKIKNCSIKNFTMQKHLFNTVAFKYIKRPVYNAFHVQKTLSDISHHTVPKVFIRIDDLFFNNLQNVHLFIDSITTLKLPVMVSIRGDDIQNTIYYPLLKKLKNAGIFIGIHGFTHTGKYGPFDSELLQMNHSCFEQRVAPVIKKLASLGQNHSVLVPPFNAIGREQILRWSKVCSIISGGPETARFTDQLYGPVALSNAGWYFPSIQPFYGDARTMLRNNVSSLVTSLKGPLCLTMHFTQEQSDNFYSLIIFLEKIYPYISHWEETESW
jgi:glycosyltransferase involved in cell wall biosynthesis